MKNKISFIAVGQAGGNLGMIFERNGYKVLYINTSQEDLDTLSGAKFKHHIKNGEGCNKDRNKAKQALIDDFDNVSRKIQEGLETELIYVLFASGGGTGSGAGPMLAELVLNDIEDGYIKAQNVGIITIIPALNESIKSNINSYECFTELTKIEGLASTVIIDNEAGDKMALNHRFVKTFVEFLEIPNKHKSERGNIDKAEIMETLKSTGMLQILQLNSKESQTDTLLEALSKSMYPEPEKDGVMKYITISQTGNIDLQMVQRELGIPVDIFQTFNDRTTIAAFAGLSLPKQRLEFIYEKVAANKEKVLHSLNANTSMEMKAGINFLAAEQPRPVRRNPKTAESLPGDEQAKPMSRRDIMAKYLNN